jgi:hypothetical protein
MVGGKKCKAKSKQSGKRCGRWASPGRDVCIIHGGRSPAPGPTHPSFKTGRFSKVLHGRSIDELYEETRKDPKILQLREDIALLVAKQKETLSRLSTGENPYNWERVQSVWQKLVAANARGDVKRAQLLYVELGAIINGANRDVLVWREYEERTETIRRLVDTERRYHEMQGRSLPPDRASLIMTILLDLIRKNATQEIAKNILNEFRDQFRATSPLTLGRPINVDAEEVE